MHQRPHPFCILLNDKYAEANKLFGWNVQSSTPSIALSGDKRTQVVYDLDADHNPDTIDELVASEQVATFGPDTLPEARNRGYRTP